MVHRGLEACERLSPLCLYVLGRLAATLQNLYKHVSVHDLAKSIQTRVCTTHTEPTPAVLPRRGRPHKRVTPSQPPHGNLAHAIRKSINRFRPTLHLNGLEDVPVSFIRWITVYSILGGWRFVRTIQFNVSKLRRSHDHE